MIYGLIAGLFAAGLVWSFPTGGTQVKLEAKAPLGTFDELQARNLPDEPRGKLNASEILPELATKSIAEREEIAVRLLEAGHFPDFLRHLKPIHVGNRANHLTFWVMPDYVSLGNDEDFVLMPLSWVNTKRLARTFGFYLPTPKMVDAIYNQADRVIWPKTYPPGPEMASVATLEAHNNWIRGQRSLYPEQDVLVAGHKKDIVISRRLQHFRDRIAIYGWQSLTTGTPIQPLSTWHGDFYVDYSHGIRLVAPWVVANGNVMPLSQAMMNPRFASLLSHEGPLGIDALMAPNDARSLANQ